MFSKDEEHTLIQKIEILEKKLRIAEKTLEEADVMIAILLHNNKVLQSLIPLEIKTSLETEINTPQETSSSSPGFKG